MEAMKLEAKIPMPSEVFVLDDALRQDDPDVVVYAVGGAVRDFLFHQFGGKEGQFKPKDTDITTNLSEEQILERLRSPYAQKLGIKVKEKESVDTFGVVFAHVNGSETLEVAPFRKDIGSADGRRPEKVVQAEVHEDAMRRDLTMNNLYYDFHLNHVLDFNPEGQGIEDIRDGIARPVGDPFERFEEDRLRVLRLVRFFSRFNTEKAIEKLDQKTLDAIDHYKHLPGISGERIFMEFMAGLKQSLCPVAYLQNYVELNLMDAVFPNLQIDAKSIHKLEGIKNPKVVLAWILKENQEIDFQLNKLKYPSDIGNAVQFLVDAMSFDPEEAFFVVKRRDKNADISAALKSDLIELSQVVHELEVMLRLDHLSSYEMSIDSGKDLLAMGLKGKEIGIEQKRQGQEHYCNSLQEFLKQKEKPVG